MNLYAACTLCILEKLLLYKLYRPALRDAAPRYIEMKAFWGLPPKPIFLPGETLIQALSCMGCWIAAG